MDPELRALGVAIDDVPKRRVETRERETIR